jgi:hypothetical protein
MAALLLRCEPEKKGCNGAVGRWTGKPIKDARTARWPGTMAQLLKMGAGTAVLLSRWLIEIRQSQTPCCGRRGEMAVAPELFDDQKVDCHAATRTRRV